MNAYLRCPLCGKLQIIDAGHARVFSFSHCGVAMQHLSALEYGAYVEGGSRDESAQSWLREPRQTLNAIYNLLLERAPGNLTIQAIEATDTSKVVKLSYGGQAVKVRMTIEED